MKLLYSIAASSIYNFTFSLLNFCLPLLSIKIFGFKLFSDKKRNFYIERNKSFRVVKKNQFEVFRSIDSPVIWIHCSSLGEYELCRPLIKKIKKHLSKYKIALTFYSPSGFYVTKNNSLIDWVGYLPLDLTRKMNLIINFINPKILILSKNDFWPNLLNSLNNRDIPIISISSKFKKSDFFWKSFSIWFYDSLKSVTHFYTSDRNSEEILNNNGIFNTTSSGDTRMDRVLKIMNENKSFKILDHFTENQKCWIAGSTWNEDLPLFLNYIKNKESPKVIIAPHDCSKNSISSLVKQLKVPFTLWSNYSFKNNSIKVLIIDKIGVLKHAYKYAEWAYIGGGMSKFGLHNILEAAVYKLPLIIGKNYKKFPEAKDLIEKGGCFSVSNYKEFETVISKILTDPEKIGGLNFNYVNEKKGATEKIFIDIKKILAKL